MITVYGKPGCSFCTKAKNLLELMKLEYQYKDIASDPLIREELFERVPNAKTVPQIFIENELIGGYDQLYARLKQDG